MMKLVLALVILAACGGDKPAPQAPVANQAQPAPPQPRPPSDDERVARAEREADQARKAAQEAVEKVDQIARDLEALNQRVDAAVNQVVAAQNDADRKAAKAKLEQLQREKHDMEARIREAKDAAMKAERKKGVKIEQKCLDNPLAAGC